MNLICTGKKIPFLSVGIGAVFFAHGKFWVRVDYEIGTNLMPSQWQSGSACDFLIDGTVRGESGVMCEEVEEVIFEPANGE